MPKIELACVELPLAYCTYLAANDDSMVCCMEEVMLTENWHYNTFLNAND